MPDNRCLKYRHDDEEEKNDEEFDKTNEKQLRIRALKATGKNKKDETKKASVEVASVKVDAIDTINIIDTFDRPGSANTESNYARSGTYSAGFENQPGQRIPRVGVYAEAGVGRAHAEYSVFEAEARGPNASAGAEISAVGARAMARAEIASASAKAGPVLAKLGLGLDTGASAGLSGVEVKFLGTGFSIGPTTGVSFLGSEVKVGCAIM